MAYLLVNEQGQKRLVILADHRRIFDSSFPKISGIARVAAGARSDIHSTPAASDKPTGDSILLVRNTEVIPDFTAALDAAGIPYVVNRGRGFYDSREVNDLTHLLRVIANPRDEISLAVVLRSPLVNVSEEALLTAKMMGNRAEHLYDVGVAGIHRLLEHREKLTQVRVIICVAGMEGALPSVVGGLVAVPVIAVPTSVGYGASFGGIAALLGMLNSCASNVTVVNIDNGFGAACVASCINRL